MFFDDGPDGDEIIELEMTELPNDQHYDQNESSIMPLTRELRRLRTI